MPRRKRGSDIGPTKRGKGSKCMVLVERQGVPVGVSIASASRAQVIVNDATLNARVLPHRRNPKHLIGDVAYDSDPLAEPLANRRTCLIGPLRTNRMSRPSEDRHCVRLCGRPLGLKGHDCPMSGVCGDAPPSRRGAIGLSTVANSTLVGRPAVSAPAGAMVGGTRAVGVIRSSGPACPAERR